MIWLEGTYDNGNYKFSTDLYAENIEDLFYNFKEEISFYVEELKEHAAEWHRTEVRDIDFEFYFTDDKNEIIEDTNNDLEEFSYFLSQSL